MIPVYNTAKLYRQQKAEFNAAVGRVLESGSFDWGPEVPAFENAFSRWIGAKHCVAVGSGSAALRAALRALGIGRGDEVITVANTDMAGSAAISAVGAKIVWVDINPESRCIDPQACAAAITSRTAAILAVDMYGHPADLVVLRALADRHGIALIDDACLALGAEIDGMRLGSIADITCYSFSSGKHLGAFGAAGACTTQDGDLADKVRKLSSDGQARERHYGQRPLALLHETEGHNEKMDEIQAAILSLKLTKLDETLAIRRNQAAIYTDRLQRLVNTPRVKVNCLHAWRNYVIELDDRVALAGHLSARSIGCNALYSPPMHLQPVYSPLGYGAGSLPQTERSCKAILGLPIGPHLGDEDVDTVAAAIAEFLR